VRKLEYISPATTHADGQRRRGQAIMLLGYLPAVLLVAMVVWYFIDLFLSFP
jgi:hypothetical protein